MVRKPYLAKKGSLIETCTLKLILVRTREELKYTEKTFLLKNVL